MGLTPFAHNRGVSAMVSATIAEIKREYPLCGIVMWGGFPEPDLSKPTSLEYQNRDYTVKYVKTKWDSSFHRSVFWLPFRLLSLITGGRILQDQVIREMISSNLVISFNYGDIFSDVHGIYNIATILRNIYPIFGQKPVLFAPQTIGPFSKKSFKLASKIILNNSKIKTIMPREPMSVKWLKESVSDHSKIIFCPDMAFLLEPSDMPSIIPGQVLKEGYVSISLNPFQVPANQYKKTIWILGKVLNDIVTQTGKYVIFIPHATSESFDCRDMAKDVSQHISKNEKLIIIEEDVLTTEELKAIIAKSELLISFLSHPIIAALSTGTPVIGISSKSPKMPQIMDLYDVKENAIPLCEILEKPEILKNRADSILYPENNKALSKLLKEKHQAIEALVRKEFLGSIKQVIKTQDFKSRKKINDEKNEGRDKKNEKR
jgi:polysaccharide pyruvyl transferase WcaK-like protein